MELQTSPLVSVIIPTFNMQKHLAETLNSVLNQTFEDWEIIVVDDNSTDSTGVIANDLARADARIKYIRLPKNSNLPAVPRNVGLQMSSGKYIAFLDHDDLWSPEKLERQLLVLEKDQTVAMVHSHLQVIRNGRTVWFPLYLPSPGTSTASASNLRKRNVIQCSSVMIRREVIQVLGGFNESPELRAVEDYQLWFRVSNSFRIAFISEIHGRYRLEKSGTSRLESMQKRLQAVDESVGTLSFESQKRSVQKIIEKVANLPAALYYTGFDGKRRQKFGLPPRYW